MGEITCPECGKVTRSYKGYGCHYGHKHDGHPLVALYGADDILDRYEDMSVNALANYYEVSRTAVRGALEYLGAERRGRGEAERHKWERMTNAEREAQVKAAHERTRELVGEGEGALQRWQRQNPTLAHEQSQAAAALGAAARRSNGMEGVTGQDHPNWRGGKSVYDAVKRSLGEDSWETTRSRYQEDDCALCREGGAIDVHHIIPLLSGGTNEDWNLLALCRPCHHRTEWYTRRFIEPVLRDERPDRTRDSE